MLLLVTAGCGDDDDDTSAGDAATTAATNAQGAGTTAASAVGGAATGIATSAQGVGTQATGSATARGETTVSATLADFSMTLDPASASGGQVKFTIKNNGQETHEFVVFKTDLAEESLPKSADQTEVDEEGAGLDLIDEKEAIEPGKTEDLEIDNLSAGKYVVICNLPEHYSQGMHASFTVR